MIDHSGTKNKPSSMLPKEVQCVSLFLLLLLLRRADSEDSFCDNSCHGPGVVTSRSCHCDKACALAYNDCCADAVQLEGYKNSTKSPRSLTCKRKALVVNACLKEFNGPDFIVNSCQMDASYEVDPIGNSPVTSEATGITYGNYYCAICNGDAEQLIMWNIKMSCPNLSPSAPVDREEAFKYIFYNYPTNEWGYVLRNNVTKKTSFHGCAVTTEIPEAHQSKMRCCDSEEVGVCADSWKRDTIRDMCDTYTDPVFSNGTRYKNLYCALCNRVDLSSLNCGEAIGPRNSHPDSDDSNKMSFSLLLDINFSEGNSVGRRLALTNCRTGEIFDPFARRCRNIVCGVPGYVMQNGLCTAAVDLPLPL